MHCTAISHASDSIQKCYRVQPRTLIQKQKLLSNSLSSLDLYTPRQVTCNVVILTDITDLPLPLIHARTIAVNWVTRSPILTPALWLTVVAVVPSGAGIVAVDSNPSWQAVTCPVLLVTGCIVKTLAFSITLRSKETLTAFQFTMVPFEARLTSKKHPSKKLAKKQCCSIPQHLGIKELHSICIQHVHQTEKTTFLNLLFAGCAAAYTYRAIRSRFQE